VSVRPAIGRLRSSRQSRLAFALISIGLLALVFVAPSGAKTINVTAPTTLNLSISRAADGTFTIEASYKSPNPRCLARDRWGPDPHGGGFVEPPTFGFNYLDPRGIGYNFPEAPGIAVPELKPVSPFERSPVIWKTVWPGSTVVSVENRSGTGPRYFKSTVSAATGVDGFAWAPGGGYSLNERAYYGKTYRSKGDKIWLKCPVTKHLEVNESDPFPISLSATSKGS
jgi:hypothetical protein